MRSSRLLIIFTGLVAVMVGVIASLALESWWLLPVALLAHLLVSFLAITLIGKRLNEGDKPDPVTEAREEEEARQGAGEGGDDGDGDDRAFAI